VTRGGRTKERGEPERRCIVTRESGPKAGLIRFVIGPEDEILPDVTERLGGRGIWVSADREALDKAVAKGLFARAGKRSVKVPPDLTDRVEALITARLVELIGLGRKAGQAIAGREKTREALLGGKAALLIQAADGSAREKAELRPPEGEDTHVTCLSGQELGLAFGRDSVIHAAMLAGGLADRVKRESLRLAGLRGRKDRRAAGDGSAGEGPRLERFGTE
jgi:predicted RNA-binding protein YlxR (DUF448 family)